jgi:hypothetical protein
MTWFLIALVALAVTVAVVRLARRRSRQRALMLACRRAGLAFAPVDPFVDTIWLPFRWLGSERWIHTENVVWLDQESDGVRAFDLVTERPAGGQGNGAEGQPVRRRYTCASAPLPFGCPRLEVRPRQVLDGVAEAITGDEIHMELASFNRRFHVTAEDRRFAVAFCSPQMMQAMLAIPDGVTIAVNEDRLLLRAQELPPGGMLLLFEAARALRTHVPTVVASLFPPRAAKGRYEDRWLQGHWSPDPTGVAGSMDDPGGPSPQR